VGIWTKRNQPWVSERKEINRGYLNEKKSTVSIWTKRNQPWVSERKEINREYRTMTGTGTDVSAFTIDVW